MSNVASRSFPLGVGDTGPIVGLPVACWRETLVSKATFVPLMVTSTSPDGSVTDGGATPVTVVGFVQFSAYQ
jgi:hypothetical protein